MYKVYNPPRSKESVSVAPRERGGVSWKGKGVSCFCFGYQIVGSEGG